MLNTARAKGVMDEHGLDVLVAASPSNVTYAADFAGLLHYELREQIYVVLLADDIQHPAIVLPMGEARDLVSDRAAGLTRIEDVRPYGTYVIHSRDDAQLDPVEKTTHEMIEAKRYGDPMGALCDTLNDRGKSGMKIGLDDELVPVAGYDSVAKRIASYVSRSVSRASDVFTEIRMVKTEEEIERLRRAATVSEAAFEEAMKYAKEGASGTELVRTLMAEVVKAGCLFRSQMHCTLSLGRKSYLQNAVHPASETLKKGDLIRFDGGGSYRFYSSDIARNAVLGRASAEQRKRYDAVLAGEQAIIDNAKPGTRASELYRISIDTIQKDWIPDFQRAHCGHTIGIDTYDGVMISSDDETIIEEGMVLNPETPLRRVRYVEVPCGRPNPHHVQGGPFADQGAPRPAGGLGL